MLYSSLGRKKFLNFVRIQKIMRLQLRMLWNKKGLNEKCMKEDSIVFIRTINNGQDISSWHQEKEDLLIINTQNFYRKGLMLMEMWRQRLLWEERRRLRYHLSYSIDLCARLIRTCHLERICQWSINVFVFNKLILVEKIFIVAMVIFVWFFLTFFFKETVAIKQIYGTYSKLSKRHYNSHHLFQIRLSEFWFITININ